ncbi:tetratricopeptide repeat protein [Microcoleus sp. S36b_A3]|uniref:tetratricopeptide repeat protein n=1 Tax=unclassified Microcoleus TaxID=2642155 RepID=UPI002FD54586
MPLPKVPKKFLPKLTSVFLFLYVAATLPLLANRLTSFAYIVQAVVQKKQNAANEATESLRQAIQPNFWDATIYQTLGFQLSARGKPEEAIAAYRQAVQINPNFAEAYKNLGEVLFWQGKPYDEAIAAYRQAVQINPNDAEAYKELGALLYFQGKPDEEIATYRQAIKVNPQWVWAYNKLGKTLSYQGKPDEEIAAYRQAVQINPNDAEAHRNLGLALQQQGRLDEAIAAYRQAIKIDTNYAEAYKNLGWILQEQGRLEEASAAYRQAIQLNLKHTQADNNLSERISAFLQNIRVNLLLKETERLLAMRKNPQFSEIPERFPSLKDEPLVSLKRSVVRVVIKNSTDLPSFTGWTDLQSLTGWVVKRQGNKAWIVTERIVKTTDTTRLQSDPEIEVEFYSKPKSGEFRKRKPAKIAKITAASDNLNLALLEVTNIPKDIKPLARASASVPLNSPTHIIGYSDDTNDDWTVTTGKVINKSDRELQISPISVIVKAGSPVLDRQNRVVAIGQRSRYHISITGSQNQEPVLRPVSDTALAFPIQSVTTQLKNWGID